MQSVCVLHIVAWLCMNIPTPLITQSCWTQICNCSSTFSYIYEQTIQYYA